jgi:MFS family permease
LNDNNAYHTTTPKPRLYYGYVIVAASFIIMILSQGLYIIFGFFIVPLLDEFGWTRAAISGAFSLSNVLQGLLGIVMGGLVDRFGPRVVVTVCGVFLGAGYMLMSQVNSIWQIYLFYGLIIGIGGSGLWVPLLSPVSRWFDERRSVMTGIVMSGLTVGGIIAPMVVSRLIDAYDWRQTFIIIGSVALVGIVIFAQFYRRDKRQIGQTPGEIESNPQIQPSPAVNGYDLKEAARTPQFWLFVVILFCFGYSIIAVTVHLVPHMTGLGISDINAGYVMSVNGGVGFIGNVFVGGYIGDRIGNKKVLLIGFAIAVASLIWLLPSRELWMFHLFAVVLGIALGSIGTSESPLIARLFGLKNHGLIYAISVLGFTAGAAVGPWVTGLIHDITESYRIAFLVCIALTAAGFILTLFLKPTSKIGTAL